MNLKNSLPMFHLRPVALATLPINTSPSFNLNGTLLASGGVDGAVHIWDLAEIKFQWESYFTLELDVIVY
jgi:WD40 repeat protein